MAKENDNLDSVLSRYRNAIPSMRTLAQFRSEIMRLVGRSYTITSDDPLFQQNPGECLKHALTFEDLTIGIPTFNRPGYLRSCLNFAAHQFPKATIIVCDASNEQNRQENHASVRLIQNSIENNKIVYREYPETISTLAFFISNTDGADTEFFFKWDDDDIYNPLGVREAIDYMKNNKNVASMTGPTINFSKQKQKWLASNHFTFPINYPTVAERVCFIGLGMVMSWYNIFRTKVYKECLADTMYLEKSAIDQLWDLSFSIALAMHGETHLTSSVLQARRIGDWRISENKQVYGRALLYKLIDEAKSRDYFRFRHHIRDLMSSHPEFIAEHKFNLTDKIVDQVCKNVFMSAGETDPIYRSIYRDLFMRHNYSNRWLRRVRDFDTDKQFFKSTAKLLEEVG